MSTTTALSGKSLRCAERLPKIQNHSDADAGVGDVKGRVDVTAEMEVDEVDDVAVQEAIDEVAQNTAAEEAEADLGEAIAEAEGIAPEKIARRVPNARIASMTLWPENMLHAAPVLPTWTR